MSAGRPYFESNSDRASSGMALSASCSARGSSCGSGLHSPPHHRRANVFTPTWSPSFVRRPVSPVGDQLHENDIVDSDGVPTSAMVVGSKPALQSRWP
jgi:hypothetical protein